MAYEAVAVSAAILCQPISLKTPVVFSTALLPTKSSASRKATEGSPWSPGRRPRAGRRHLSARRDNFSYPKCPSLPQPRPPGNSLSRPKPKQRHADGRCDGDASLGRIARRPDKAEPFDRLPWLEKKLHLRLHGHDAGRYLPPWYDTGPVQLLLQERCRIRHGPAQSFGDLGKAAQFLLGDEDGRTGDGSSQGGHCTSPRPVMEGEAGILRCNSASG